MDAHKSFNVINPFQKGQNRGRRTGKIISKKRPKRNDEMNSFDEYLSDSANEQSLIMSQKVVPTKENLQPPVTAQVAAISPIIIIQSETQTHISSAPKETQESEVFVKALNPFAGNARYGRRTGKDLLAGKRKLLSNGLANFSDFFSDSDASFSIHGTPSEMNTPTVHSKDVFVKPKKVPATPIHLAQPVSFHANSGEPVSSDINRSKRNKSPAHGLAQIKQNTIVNGTPRKGDNESINKAVKTTVAASESAVGANVLKNLANESNVKADESKDEANETNDGANESKDGANGSDDAANDSNDRANELDVKANESKDGANETTDGANESKDGASESDNAANASDDVGKDSNDRANESDDVGNESDHGANKLNQKANESHTGGHDNETLGSDDEANEPEMKVKKLDNDGANKCLSSNELDENGANQSDVKANKSNDEASESDDETYQSVHKANKSNNKLNKSVITAKASANRANQSSNSTKKRTKSKDFNNSLRRSSGTEQDDANLELQNNVLNLSKILNSTSRKSTQIKSKSSVIESNIVKRNDKSLSTNSNIAVLFKASKNNLTDLSQEDKKYKEVEQETLDELNAATTNSKNLSKTAIHSSSDCSKVRNKSSQESSSGDQKYKVKELDKPDIAYSDNEKSKSRKTTRTLTKQNTSRSHNKSLERYEKPTLSKKRKSDKLLSDKNVYTVPEDVNTASEKQKSISLPSTSQDKDDGQVAHEQETCENSITSTKACLNFDGDVAGSLSKTEQALPSQFFGIKKRLDFSNALADSTKKLKEKTSEDFNSFVNEYFHLDLPTKALSKSLSKRSNAQMKLKDLDITLDAEDDFIIVDEPIVVNIRNNSKKSESKKSQTQRKSTQKVKDKENNTLILGKMQSPTKEPEVTSIKPIKRKRAMSSNVQIQEVGNLAVKEIQSPTKELEIVSTKPNKRNKAMSSNVHNQKVDNKAVDEIQSPIKEPQIMLRKPNKRKTISSNVQYDQQKSESEEVFQDISPLKKSKDNHPKTDILGKTSTYRTEKQTTKPPKRGAKVTKSERVRKEQKAVTKTRLGSRKAKKNNFHIESAESERVNNLSVESEEDVNPGDILNPQDNSIQLNESGEDLCMDRDQDDKLQSSLQLQNVEIEEEGAKMHDLSRKISNKQRKSRSRKKSLFKESFAAQSLSGELPKTTKSKNVSTLHSSPPHEDPLSKKNGKVKKGKGKNKEHICTNTSESREEILPETPVYLKLLSALPQVTPKSGISFRLSRRLTSIPPDSNSEEEDNEGVENDLFSTPRSHQASEGINTPTGIGNSAILTSCLKGSSTVKHKRKGRRVTINKMVEEQDVTPRSIERPHSSSTIASESGLLSMSSSPVHYAEMTTNVKIPTTSHSPKIVLPDLSHKIVPPESPPHPGLRRSKRTRVIRLNRAIREGIIYRRDSTGFGLLVDGVQPSIVAAKIKAKEEERRRKHRRKLQSITVPAVSKKRLSTHRRLSENVTMSSQYPVLDPDTETEVLVDCMARQSSVTWYGPDLNPVLETDPLAVSLLIQQPSFSSGELHLRPFSEKPLGLAVQTLIYYVVFGKIAVTINKITTVAEIGDSFFIPRGNLYSLKNLRRDVAKLYFVDLGDRLSQSASL